MRIGIVTGEYPPMRGGVGAYSAILAHRWHAAGHTVSLFSSIEAQEANAEISITYAPDRWKWRSLLAIRQWARQENLDIVNLQYQTAAYGMSPFIHFLPQTLREIAPVVTTFHDLRYPYLFPKAGKLRDWIVAHLARNSSGAICTNPEDYEQLRDHPLVAMIPIGSNIRPSASKTERPSAWRKQAQVNSAEFLIGYFGFMNHTKGILELLQALHELTQAGVSAHLLLVGERLGSADPSNRDFAQMVDQRIHALRLESRITWTGYLEEDALGDALKACDVIALPFLDGASYRRGTLMAAIEFGCPIITTEPRVPSPGFEHQQTLYLVPAGDIQALAHGLNVLRQDAALRQRLQQGAETLRQRFQWDTIASDCLDLFQRVKKEER